MTTRDKLTFALEMARATRATVRQCEALMRYGHTLWMMERDYSVGSIAKRERIRDRIWRICDEMRIPECPGCNVKRDDMGALAHKANCQYGIHGIVLQPTPVFTGARLKIRTPGGEEIVVPS